MSLKIINANDPERCVHIIHTLYHLKEVLQVSCNKLLVSPVHSLGNYPQIQSMVKN